MDELERLKRENMAIQEILAHVLERTGTVFVSKSELGTGKFAGKRINIENSIEKDGFEISLVEEK